MSQQTFWGALPTIIILLITIVGWIYAIGKGKERMSHMLTREEFEGLCKANQNTCAQDVGKKVEEINKSIQTSNKELRVLVIDLHSKQSDRIEKMDEKRELAKDGNTKSISELNTAIGRIEGVLETIRSANL
jgi:hypothetical protein